MILPTSSDVFHLGFGIVAGIASVAFVLFAWEDIRLRGAPRAVAGFAAALFILILLLVAASQLDPLLGNWTIDPKTRLPVLEMPGVDWKRLPRRFGDFVSATSFWAALLGGIVTALLILITRADSAEEEAEIEAADMPGELAMAAEAEAMA